MILRCVWTWPRVFSPEPVTSRSDPEAHLWLWIRLLGSAFSSLLTSCSMSVSWSSTDSLWLSYLLIFVCLFVCLQCDILKPSSGGCIGPCWALTTWTQKDAASELRHGLSVTEHVWTGAFLHVWMVKLPHRPGEDHPAASRLLSQPPCVDEPKKRLRSGKQECVVLTVEACQWSQRS